MGYDEHVPRGLCACALLLTLSVGSVGCGRLGFDPLDGATADAGDAGAHDAGAHDGGMRDAGMHDAAIHDGGTSDAGGCAYREAHTVPEIDTADDESQVTVSRNGQRLCFVRSTTMGPSLYCASHDGVTWGAPREQAMLNAHPFVVRSPALSDDGETLYYASDRGGGAGGFDLWVARWNAMPGVFGGPSNVPSVNTSADEGGPELSPDQRALYFDRGSAGATNLFVSTRATTADAFGDATMLSGTAMGDAEIAIAPDRMHVLFCSQRSTTGVGAGHSSIWCGGLSGTTVSGIEPLSAPGMDGACSPAFGSVGELYFDVEGFSGGAGGRDVVVTP